MTGLSSILDDEIQPEFKDVDYSVDAEKARDLLETAGYTWKDDALIDPDGAPVSFTLSVPSGWSDWNTAQELIAEDVTDAIGAEVKIDMPDWGGWADPRDNGTFSAIIHWLEDSGTAYGLYTSTMDPRWISDGKAGFNFGRFDDPEATGRAELVRQRLVRRGAHRGTRHAADDLRRAGAGHPRWARTRCWASSTPATTWAGRRRRTRMRPPTRRSRTSCRSSRSSSPAE